MPAHKGHLRVLVVEDSEADFDLLELELRRSGYDPEMVRVETAAQLGAALDREPWDVVLTDWSLPAFGALAAIEVVKQRAIDVPVIVASGSVDEETAVTAMRAGARDYLPKNNLARLAPAIERELHEASLRRERERFQEQLLISDRMASVGILAAGVAHEINNPLAAVMANLEIAAHYLRDAERAPDALGAIRESLADTMKAAERIRDIVRDVRIFSRSGEGTRTLIDVRDVVQSSLRMAWNEIRHRARVVEEFGDVGAVLGDESRLGQVFLNLIVNAAQAIPVGRAESNEIRVATRTDVHGRVAVDVTDTGSGMSPDVVRRLFAPFFTTKARGAGTGLGLSICRRIVTEHEGEITVTSTPGVGTTFTVLLPTAASTADESREVPLVAPPATRRGRVLVVDDDRAVVAAIARTIADEHEVVALTSGADALARLRAGERFDAILCDVMMPELTGIELHAAIDAAWPDQAARLVFLTGGTFTDEARTFLAETHRPTLEKPFTRVELRALVNELVERAPAATG